MNKNEVVARLREHLRAKGYDLKAKKLYITPNDKRWCLTFIKDCLGQAYDAETLFYSEVLKGVKLLTKKLRKLVNAYQRVNILHLRNYLRVQGLVFTLSGTHCIRIG